MRKEELLQVTTLFQAWKLQPTNNSNKKINKSDEYYLCHESPEKTARWLFKEISMHYVCKNYLKCEFKKFSTRIKPKVSAPWHWNSINEASMLLPKDFSNNFAEIILFLRDIKNIFSDQQPVIPTQSVIFMFNLHKIVSSFNK